MTQVKRLLSLAITIFSLTLTTTVHAIIEEDVKISLTFRNELPEPVILYFDDEANSERIAQNDGEPIPPLGGHLTVFSYAGHRFSYDYGGERHYEYVDLPNSDEPASLQVLLAGQNEIKVKCTVSFTTALNKPKGEAEITMRIVPWWAPRGASHFLSLVRKGYYDGAGLSRVIPTFLTQFGISPDYHMRKMERMNSIKDDTPLPQPIRFQPGMISYAGSGPDTRTTEVFIVMPDASEEQLDYFGTNVWETPFGVIDDVHQTAVTKWFSYGDMPPYGHGPDPQAIYERDGYEYLQTKFPNLDYIQKCQVIEIKPDGNGQAVEEL